MRQPSPRALVVTALAGLLLLPLAALPAEAAGGLDRFQLGGRGVYQVGALVARADDPSAVSYNPAGIGHFTGLQIQAGADFDNATDKYGSETGTFRANHTIQFPPSLFATWRPDDHGPWSFGIGVTTPYWYRVDWDPALFPGRFKTRVSELRLWEVHPVVAYEVDDNWSVGGGLRYLTGNLEHGSNVQGEIEAPGGGPVPFELSTLAQADVDAFSFDLGIQYATNAWGWGATYRHGADLDATDRFEVGVRDIADASFSDDVLAAFDFDRARLSFELPWQVAGGVWIAPYPELRLELDLVYQGWSVVENTDYPVFSPTQATVVIEQPRNWDDTLSVRLGAEGELTDQWTVGGGVAYEPSPVDGDTLEPGFARDDALVYAVGFTYNAETVEISAGFSFHDYSDRGAAGQELLDPDVTGSYDSRAQVWSVSARWTF